MQFFTGQNLFLWQFNSPQVEFMHPYIQFGSIDILYKHFANIMRFSMAFGQTFVVRDNWNATRLSLLTYI